MIVDRRVYRTVDGRLVEEGDPEAAFLAYPAGEEVVDAEARRSGLTEFLAKAGVKAKAKPADKAVTRHEDKAAPVGGLTTNRASTKEQS